MKAGKVFFFFLFLIATIVNSVLMYINTPLSNYTAFATLLTTLLVLGLSALLTLIATASDKRFIKKLMMRLQIVFLLILVIASLVLRIIEAISGNFNWYFVWRVGATVLYFIVFLITVSMSKDVFRALKEIYYSRF